MADVRPFVALRYAPGLGPVLAGGPGSKDPVPDLSSVLAPPYDVIEPAERARLSARSSYNVVAVDLPDGPEPYRHAEAVFDGWLAAGVLVPDERPSVTVTEQRFTGPDGVRHVRKGLIAGLRLEPFSAGIVFPHEHTLRGPKEDRLRLFTACGATASQVFCVYDDPTFALDVILAPATSGAPDVVATSDDGVSLSAWRVDDPAVTDAITRFFEGRSLLIADGHHRYETHLAYAERERTRLGQGAVPSERVGVYLANLADPGTVVYPIHRLIRDVEGFDRDAFVGRLAEHFEIRPFEQARGAAVAALASELGWAAFAVVWPDWTGLAFGLREAGRDGALGLIDTPEPLRSFPLTVLHELVLARLLGIDAEALATERNVDYVKADDAAFDAKLASGRYHFGLWVPASDARTVAATAAAGLRMPQKSTFFFPKVLTGLVFTPLTRLSREGG